MQRYLVKQPDQLQLLASPVRQEIIDEMVNSGPCSVKEIATELGCSADSLYYHIKKLEEHGLIAEEGTRPTTRRDEKVYDVPARKVQVHYDPTDPENTENVAEIISSMLKITDQNFREGFQPELAQPEGSARNLWGTRQKAWLNEEELREVNRLMRKLRNIFWASKKTKDRNLHALTMVLTPIKEQPLRKS